jgi:hypothetical protein
MASTAAMAIQMAAWRRLRDRFPRMKAHQAPAPTKISSSPR